MTLTANPLHNKSIIIRILTLIAVSLISLTLNRKILYCVTLLPLMADALYLGLRALSQPNDCIGKTKNDFTIGFSYSVIRLLG